MVIIYVMNVSLTGSYSLEPILFGFRINISNSSPAQLYTLNLQDQGDMTKKIYSHDTRAKTAFEILKLKPCTSYGHKLSFKLQQTDVYCNHTVNTIATLEPSE